MQTRERLVTTLSALAFLATAIAIAVLVPDERHVDPLLTIALSLPASRSSCRSGSSSGGYFGSPEQLAIVPLLLLGPLPYVPLLVAAGGILSLLPDFVARHVAPGALGEQLRRLVALHRSGRGPGRLRPGPLAAWPSSSSTRWQLVAQFGTDVAWGLIRNHLIDRHPVREGLRGFAGDGSGRCGLHPGRVRHLARRC